MSILLRGITWEHARGHGSVAAAARAYEAVRPDVTVTWEARSLQAFADAPLPDLADRYDLLVIDHPHVPLAARDGLLLPLDGSGHDDALAGLAARSVGPSHDSYRHDGHQWGLATDAAAQVAAVRPDLLPDPPRTWPDVLALAEEGRVLWAGKPIDAFSSLVTTAANLGTPPWSTTGGFLDAPTLMAAMALLHDLADRVPAQCLSWNPIQVADALSDGDRWAYAPLGFGYVSYSQPGYRPHRLRYLDIPAGPGGVAGSLLGGAGIAVSARTRHPEAAVEHAFWLASSDVQRGPWFAGGGQPGHADAWEDDALNGASLDFFHGTRATLEAATVRPRTRGYLAFQDAAAPLVTATLRREMTDDALHARLAALAQAHLENA